MSNVSRLDEHIARVVAEAPPLSVEQRATLARLLTIPAPDEKPDLVVDAADVLAEMRGSK